MTHHRQNLPALPSKGLACFAATLAIAACGHDTATNELDTAIGPDGDDVAVGFDMADDLMEPLDLSPIFDFVAPPPEDIIDPDAAPCEGCTGSPCSTNSDCNSGFCLEGPAGLECVRTCDESCPPGYACRGVQSGGNDPVFLCLYEHVTFCQPCNAHADCERGVGSLSGARCLELVPEQGRFCRTPCTPGSCPEGSICEEVAITASSTAFLCRPLGECACSARAISLEASTGCSNTNDFGSCQGTRTCTDEGLGACTAATASAELCNSLDDDCNGLTDEAFAGKGEPCDGDDSDQCQDGVAVCDDAGGLVCTDDAEGRTEVCNDRDDDCDGLTDEDFLAKGLPCDGDDADRCEDGVWSCDGLSLVCGDDANSTTETCDGRDDDCDGLTDLQDPDLVAPFNSNQLGACAGTRQACNGAAGFADNYSSVAGFGRAETPDANFADENCDGIDGDEARAIFVAQGARNNSECTRINPCATLSHAVSLAGTARPHIYVQAGTYNGIVEIDRTVEIYGGFNTNWQRRPRTESGHRVVLRGAMHPSDGEFVTVRVRNATVRMTDLVIEGPGPAATDRRDGRGKSSYAVHALNSNVTVERVEVVQGNGASGQDGSGGLDASSLTAPAKAAKGGNATQAVDTCNASSRGGAVDGATNGTCPTGTAGGRSGQGGVMDRACTNVLGALVCFGSDCNATGGSQGSSGSGSSAGSGGNAGSGGTSCGGVGNGTAGGTPSQGAGGDGGGRGGLLISNYWYGGNGVDGTTGSHGSGGGGGGGSGGCDNNGGVPLQNSSGAGGGGGGAGGCAAREPGRFGRAGGGSFGIVAVGGSVNATACRFVRGNGGNGGQGGAGGRGQPGGEGGDGGNAAGTSQAGGRGGNGGDGAGSGGGGGGAGGNSIAIFSQGAQVSSNSNEFVGGSGGAGGTGGTAAANTGINGPGRSGQTGRVEATWTCAAAGACGN
jgi:hypothetical protein